MNKVQLREEARQIINELIQEAQLGENEYIRTKYKGACIHLANKGMFKDMTEYCFEYYKLIDDKLYKMFSYCYDVYDPEKKKVGNWYFDICKRHSFTKIKNHTYVPNYDKFEPKELKADVCI
jgi:hypothetical protein